MENNFRIGQIIKLYEADNDQYVVLNHYKSEDTTYLMLYPYDENQKSAADLTKSIIIKYTNDVNEFEYVKDKEELMKILPYMISVEE